MSNFYTKYCKLCAEKGETASKAAVNIGFSRATATGWKNGKQPNDVTLVRIADYFGVPVSRLDNSSRVEPFNYDPQPFAEDKPAHPALYETAQVRVLIDTFMKLDEIKKAKLLVYASELAQS